VHAEPELPVDLYCFFASCLNYLLVYAAACQSHDWEGAVHVGVNDGLLPFMLTAQHEADANYWVQVSISFIWTHIWIRKLTPIVRIAVI
jgi:hypothetical protein